MDQITKHKLDQAAQELIASIDLSKVCELASSFHVRKRACRILSEWKKGSYNVCFPVIFDQDTEVSEKWMVRIPLLPRLAFPEEKMRSEVATMKYIAEKTTIPVPHLYGYSIKCDNILGLPFMLLEYIEGKTLFDIKLKNLEQNKREHLYAQLSDVYIQLYQQKFDRIGALTLDEDDHHWVFVINNRPLTVDINEQEVSGLDICRYLHPHQTFASTIDYVFFITRLIFNDFQRRRDSILSENDARWYLYSIFASQSILMEWIKPEYNHGPFILMHGDLRPPNIVIDDDFNLVSILDWEWSHTVPVQLFTPPFWLTNQAVLQISKDIPSLQYYAAVRRFCLSVYEQESRRYKLPLKDLPLTNLWRPHTIESLLIAHGLSNPHYFGNVYCDALDQHYYGENPEERMQAFFRIRKNQLHIVEQKILEFAEFEKERQELGVEKRVALPYPTRTPQEEAELVKKMEAFYDSRHKVDASAEVRRDFPVYSKPKPQAKVETYFGPLLEFFYVWTHRPHPSDPTDSLEVEGGAERKVARLTWPVMGISAISIIYIVSRNWKKYK